MKKVLLSGVAALALFATGTAVASADQTGDPNAFICPVVGEGVLNNAEKLGSNAFPGGGATFTPGKERAGDHANMNALNENGTPSLTNRPGADGFTPIWNPANP
jgi:hypothetical protein